MARFKPGQSGNPKGRPRGTGLSDALRKLMEMETQSGDGKKLKTVEALAAGLIKLALSGDVRAHALIWERYEGKVPLAMDTGSLPVSFTLLTDTEGDE